MAQQSQFKQFYWRWTVAIVAFGILIAVVAQWLVPQVQAISTFLHEHARYALPVGIALQSLAIALILRSISLLLNFEDARESHLRENFYAPALVGLAEQIAYIVAFSIAKPEAIAVWLAFKAVGTWSRWAGQSTPDESPQPVPLTDSTEDRGRRRYHRYLLGNLLQVGSAFLIWWLIIK